MGDAAPRRRGRALARILILGVVLVLLSGCKANNDPGAPAVEEERAAALSTLEQISPLRLIDGVTLLSTASVDACAALNPETITLDPFFDRGLRCELSGYDVYGIESPGADPTQAVLIADRFLAVNQVTAESTLQQSTVDLEGEDVHLVASVSTELEGFFFNATFIPMADLKDTVARRGLEYFPLPDEPSGSGDTATERADSIISSAAPFALAMKISRRYFDSGQTQRPIPEPATPGPEPCFGTGPNCPGG